MSHPKGGDCDAGPREADFRTQLLDEVSVLTMKASSLAASTVLAEDLVQDTIERALRNQERFAPGTSLRSWLMRIMRNLFIDRCREHTRRKDGACCPEQAIDERELPVAPPEPESVRPWELLGGADLAAALHHLDEPLRRTFELANFGGLSYEAIA